jgi:hypothetical protein
MNYKQRKSVSIRVFFIMLDALLPQQPPQGNRILDKGFFVFVCRILGAELGDNSKVKI